MQKVHVGCWGHLAPTPSSFPLGRDLHKSGLTKGSVGGRLKGRSASCPGEVKSTVAIRSPRCLLRNVKNLPIKKEIKYFLGYPHPQGYLRPQQVILFVTSYVPYRKKV